MAVYTIDFKPKSKKARVRVISATVEAKNPHEAIVIAKQTLLSGSRFQATVVSS